jgi:hypothetical protein
MDINSLIEKLPLDKLPQGVQDQIAGIKDKVTSGELNLDDAKAKINELVGGIDLEGLKDKIPGNLDDGLIDKAKGLFGK